MIKGFNKLYVILLSFFVLFSCQGNTRQKGQTDNHNMKIDDIFNENNNAKILSVSEDVVLGVVVLKEEYNDGKLTIYNDDGSIWKSFVYNDSFSDNEIQPFALKPENILLVFKCVGKKSKYYAVVVNENKREIKYIKQSDTFFKYETWQQHLVNVFSVGFDNKQNPIRLEPNDKAKQLPYNKEEFYHPVKVNGSWLMIKDDNEKKGWIRWKDEKGNLTLMLYYDA